MKKLYLDKTELKKCLCVMRKDAEVIPAGTTISSMPVEYKDEEYERFAEQYDIHFIFDDNIPVIDFYSIPQIDIFATDSNGGFIGSLGQKVDLESNVPICYIDCNRICYLIAENGAAFLQNASTWKTHLDLYNGVKFYRSKIEAEKENEFLSQLQQ